MTADHAALQSALAASAQAAVALAAAPRGARDAALAALAASLEAEAPALLAANQADVEQARREGLSEVLVDRLALNPARLAQLAAGVRAAAALPDPLGRLEDCATLPDGLEVGRLRIPLGLIAFICEARPGAAAEAAALAVKSGNALLVKTGREAARSAEALAPLMARSLETAGLPAEAVRLLPRLTREELQFLLTQDELVDLVVPRGGEALIRFVAESSRIPTLKHYKGVCHLYVDQGADLDMAAELAVDGKCSRPGVCNALECLLVADSEAEAFLALAGPRLTARGVELRACPRTRPLLPGARPAAPDDFGREFLDLRLAVKAVADLDAALDHIRAHGSRHTESICTRDLERARRFQRLADAGCVLVNASTRLNDGGCLGLGAEMGISTTKLHAYGPMGLRELTTTKFVVVGQGHLRQ
ncbi:MAG: glutamate-5-semialdehyde dehydrogenase [Deltaproteobacteria bacterium]|jgi:glutamate-5-semialdehyde dehydrogenase|nr:glutamate-5-semialdehyde dehydrogenase [Deltaproteobacteria bacterium]